MSIALRGITKSFQGVTVIPPLTIEFSSRAFTTLLGPSGCGKTTLLRMIAGLETPDAGEILFDEPLSALDAQLRETMRGEIKRITSALAMTSIFVTHDQEEAMSMSDRILVLNHGALEQAGAPIDIYTHPATRFVAEFVGQSNFIDDQRMFRPEFAEIIDLEENSSSNHSLIFTARVEQTEYIGDRWLIDVSVGDKHWRLAHSAPQTIGSQIHIAVNPAGIVTVGG